ncbi:MAG: type II toxin-antitoxin system VapC family toxin [Microcella sp.]|uniref:type II toxin-antitoxin system VapC family toxin n=1 Tax=Microcella sp. TaxID=1913979 RepID=UPI0024CD1510|nr:type II toxin-antitoxin system VapC family toxin [Microcella sp.]UYN84030.1 MAG: type II toxin-antitoxin system VapC family toxin [Microcella sp.]
MTLLLDTHVLIWALGAPERIPPPVRARLNDRREHLVVSAASAFEIATKHRLGRLPEAAVLVQAFDSQCARLGADVMPITAQHASTAGSLDWSHRDPFDRLLATQAMSEGCELVSADAAFQSLAGLTVLWA